MPDRRRAPFLLRDPFFVTPLAVLLLIALASLLLPLVIPTDPIATDLRARLLPPSAEHWLGTDGVGRDVFIRMLFGTRISLLIGFAAVALGFTVGVLAALLAGYFGGWVNAIIGRLIDAQLSIPFLLLVLSIMAVLGPSTTNVIIVLGLTSWLAYARVVTPEVQRVRAEPFIVASHSIGTSRLRVLFRGILPNVINLAIPIAALEVGGAIIGASTLDFFGVGTPPPYPTLGSMITEGKDSIATAWWISLFPGLMITALVACCSLIADETSKYFNPRERSLRKRRVVGPGRAESLEPAEREAVVVR